MSDKVRFNTNNLMRLHSEHALTVANASQLISQQLASKVSHWDKYINVRLTYIKEGITFHSLALYLRCGGSYSRQRGCLLEGGNLWLASAWWHLRIFFPLEPFSISVTSSPSLTTSNSMFMLIRKKSNVHRVMPGTHRQCQNGGCRAADSLFCKYEILHGGRRLSGDSCSSRWTVPSSIFEGVVAYLFGEQTQ